jgi:septum formation protein
LPYKEDKLTDKRNTSASSFQRGGLLPVEKGTACPIQLVLASRSQARKDILQQLGLSFTIDPADIDENIQDRETPAEHVSELAYRKVVKVSGRHPSCLVIGADTVIVDDQGIIGKPHSPVEARAILARLSGKSHKVITGMAIINSATGASARKWDISTVTVRSLSPQTIERYIQTDEPFGKAGGYALQGLGALLIARVQGDYNNVLGLSITSFVEALEELGYELL